MAGPELAVTGVVPWAGISLLRTEWLCKAFIVARKDQVMLV